MVSQTCWFHWFSAQFAIDSFVLGWEKIRLSSWKRSLSLNLRLNQLAGQKMRIESLTVWMAICTSRAPCLPKSFPHWTQANFFSWRSVRGLKISIRIHSNWSIQLIMSTECELIRTEWRSRWWRSRPDLVLRCILQISHWNGLSPCRKEVDSFRIRSSLYTASRVCRWGNRLECNLPYGFVRDFPSLVYSRMSEDSGYIWIGLHSAKKRRIRTIWNSYYEWTRIHWELLSEMVKFH